MAELVSPCGRACEPLRQRMSQALLSAALAQLFLQCLRLLFAPSDCLRFVLPHLTACASFCPIQRPPGRAPVPAGVQPAGDAPLPKPAPLRTSTGGRHRGMRMRPCVCQHLCMRKRALATLSILTSRFSDLHSIFANLRADLSKLYWVWAYGIQRPYE